MNQKMRLEEHCAKRTLWNLKNELEENDISALGQSIFNSRKAKAAKDQDSPLIQGKVYANRTTNKHFLADLICDSGCTYSVISKSICEAQNIPIIPLNSNIIIRNGSGYSLNIVGTSKVCIENFNVLGQCRRMI